MPHKVLTNRDRIVNADRPIVARLVVDLFNTLDQSPPHIRNEEKLLALAGAFVLMASVLKVSAQEAFTAVKNLMTDPLGPDGLVQQFAAMRFHLEEELCKG